MDINAKHCATAALNDITRDAYRATGSVRALLPPGVSWPLSEQHRRNITYKLASTLVVVADSLLPAAKITLLTASSVGCCNGYIVRAGAACA